MEMGGEILKNLQSGPSYHSVPKSTLTSTAEVSNLDWLTKESPSKDSYQ